VPTNGQVSTSLTSSIEATIALSTQDATHSDAALSLITHLELYGLRCSAVLDQGNNAVQYIAIAPKDIPTLRHICGDLQQVKLIRTLGASGESQIIIDDGSKATNRYSSVRFVPQHLDKTASRHIQSRLSTLVRYVRAWLRPNGVFCVVLGPDGVGKSTTILRMQAELQRLLGPCRKERWRPGVVRQVTPDSSNRMPHARTPRGNIASILSILGLALDFNIGYLISAYPAMARSETLIFDRYFHDLLIDPKRYRYSGPMGVPRSIRRLIPPRKTIFIILDADEDVILRRKQELSQDELRRQRVAYKDFSSSVSNAMIVRTDKPVDEIVAEIVDKIVTILAAQMPRWRRL